MSFSDLLTSSRGPGVIGTLLALLVLVGFGTLYFFVSDESMQGGGKRIEAVIRDQGLEIESLKKQIADRKGRLEEGQAFRKQADEITQLELRVAADGKRVEDLEAAKNVADAAGEAARQRFEDYKDAYRAAEWASAVGEKIDELKTLSGAIYHRAVVRKVDHIGMEITDETGNRRIDSADLPEALQDRFQFDTAKKEAAASEEDEIFKTHAGNVQIAALAKQAQDKLIQIREHKARIEKANAGIRRFKVEEPRMRMAIEKKKQEIANERRKRGGISRAPQMEVERRQMEEALVAARRTSGGFEREIRDSKAQINRLENEVNRLKLDIAELKDAGSTAGQAGQ